MCERWRTLDVQDFVSPLRIRTYLRSLDWPAFGGADGLVRKVYPHLGIDLARIRAARGIEGTFNVCNYTEKTNVAVPNRELDEGLLVAAVSLPMLMPPVEHDGALYLDSAWIKDTNPTEAVRRGAEEIWLVWCIGNTGVYRSGAFNQYVHMIELSANGGLAEELAHLRTELGSALPRLHVIKPEYPLPLDPDFYLGRIDASALIALGYRDAKRYLAAAAPDGVAWDQTATRMRDPVPGAAFADRIGDVEVRAEIHDVGRFLAGERRGDLVGLVGSTPAVSGSFELARGRLRYELVLADGRRVAHAVGTRRLSLLRSLQASGTDSVEHAARIVARLARLFTLGR
jgi:hypothetical protein